MRNGGNEVRTESPDTVRQLLCQQLLEQKMNDNRCKPFEGAQGSQEGVNGVHAVYP